MTQPDSEIPVTVVLPTYNRRPFLEDAVRSVLSQTYHNLELLVVDDGSTDSTPEYLAQISDPRLRVIRGAHTGSPARARNAGIREARGRYVAFLDSDDRWLPDKLGIQVSGLATDRSCRWSYTGVTRIDQSGQPLHDPAVAPWRPYAGPTLEGLITLRAIVATSAVLVDRRLLEETGGFEEDLPYCEDYDLWHRLALRSPARVEPAMVTEIRAHREHYSADRLAVYRSWAKVYARLGPQLTDRRLRAVCARRRVRQMIIVANLSQAARGSLAGLGAMVVAFPYCWRHSAWWWGLVKVVARALRRGRR